MALAPDPHGNGAHASGVRPARRILLHYPGLARPLLLIDAGEVLDGLNAAISGWEPAPIDEAAEGPRPVAVVERRNGCFRLTSDFLDAPLDGLPAASAVCGVIADLAQSFFTERPGCIALHCGAFLIAGRLVALTGCARAGKSTLMARLSAEPDLRVLCDDVLPILDDGHAHGLGIAPRLRLPLPATASAAFRAHVGQSTGPRDDRYAYIAAPTVAPHGTRAPLSVLVVLDRKEEASARLHRIDPAEAVHHLLAQNMADPGADPGTFERATRLAEAIFPLRLVYSDLEEAVALLRSAFGAEELPDPAISIGPPLRQQMAQPEVQPLADMVSRWRRSPEVAVRRFGAEFFLWHTASQRTFHLNAVAAAVWQLLDPPASAAGIVEVLLEVFPDETGERIESDIRLLLAQLAAEDLILHERSQPPD